MLLVLTVGALALAAWLLMRGAASPGAPPRPGDPARLDARAAPPPLAVRPGEPRPAPRLGGPDVAKPYQFHRVTPAGPRVVCVNSTLHHTTGPVAPVVRWGCAPVDVPATGVIEVEVALDRS